MPTDTNAAPGEYYVDKLARPGRKPFRVVKRRFDRLVPLRDRCNRVRLFFTEAAAQAAADRMNGKDTR